MTCLPYPVKVLDIRNAFAGLRSSESYVIDKSGVKLLEITGACFVADEDHIFGLPNQDYISRELEWYESMSLYVDDIPGGAPTIWKQVSSHAGKINSNYGWAIWSEENGSQYSKVLDELRANPLSRRAIMIYTRPTMHTDAFVDGMSDFMCTNSVQYMIRDGALNSYVQMRSNDAWAGYRNDYAWQKVVLEMLAAELEVPVGEIIWMVGSLHVYEKQFRLVDEYLNG